MDSQYQLGLNSKEKWWLPVCAFFRVSVFKLLSCRIDIDEKLQNNE